MWLISTPFSFSNGLTKAASAAGIGYSQRILGTGGEREPTRNQCAQNAGYAGEDLPSAGLVPQGIRQQLWLDHPRMPSLCSRQGIMSRRPRAIQGTPGYAQQNRAV